MFKLKYKEDGQIDRFKARLVAKSNSETEGIDYQETFAIVVKMVKVRFIIALAAAENWEIYQIDVYNAFYKVTYLRKSIWNYLKVSLVLRKVMCASFSSPFMASNKPQSNGMSSS